MRLVSCGEATIDHKNSGEAAHVCPCIYLETKHCGKKFEFFYDDNILLLTKKSPFEILITQKMNEWKIEKKYHFMIVQSFEVLFPILVLVLIGFLFTRE